MHALFYTNIITVGTFVDYRYSPYPCASPTSWSRRELLRGQGSAWRGQFWMSIHIRSTGMYVYGDRVGCSTRFCSVYSCLAVRICVVVINHDRKVNLYHHDLYTATKRMITVQCRFWLKAYIYIGIRYSI